MIGYYVPPAQPDTTGPYWAIVVMIVVILAIFFGPMLWLGIKTRRDERRVLADRRKYGPGPR